MDGRLIDIFCTGKEIGQCRWTLLGAKPYMPCRVVVGALRLITSYRMVRDGHILIFPQLRHECTPKSTCVFRTLVCNNTSKEPVIFHTWLKSNCFNPSAVTEFEHGVMCAYLLSLFTTKEITPPDLRWPSVETHGCVCRDPFRIGTFCNNTDFRALHGINC